jgi:hypothetical protein
MRAIAMVRAVLSVAALLLAGPTPRVDLRPLRPITTLRIGQCSVDLVFKLTIEDRNVEDYYCPRVEWEWEDDTRSTEESDCPPFDRARPEDHRHTWTRTWPARRAGDHVVKVRLYKADRVIRILQTKAQVLGWEGMSEQQRQRRGCPP